jgi:hypothetical protein
MALARYNLTLSVQMHSPGHSLYLKDRVQTFCLTDILSAMQKQLQSINALTTVRGGGTENSGDDRMV